MAGRLVVGLFSGTIAINENPIPRHPKKWWLTLFAQYFPICIKGDSLPGRDSAPRAHSRKGERAMASLQFSATQKPRFKMGDMVWAIVLKNEIQHLCLISPLYVVSVQCEMIREGGKDVFITTGYRLASLSTRRSWPTPSYCYPCSRVFRTEHRAQAMGQWFNVHATPGEWRQVLGPYGLTPNEDSELWSDSADTSVARKLLDNARSHDGLPGYEVRELRECLARSGLPRRDAIVLPRLLRQLGVRLPRVAKAA